MDVKFSCSVCRKLLVLDESCIGRKVQCPFCGNVFTLQRPQLQQIEPNRPEQNTSTRQEQEGMKSCPMCGEKILASAKKCRYCGEYLNQDQQHTIVNGSNPTFHIIGKLEKVSVGICGLSASFGDIAA